MWRIIIVALLLGVATTAYKTPSHASIKPVQIVKEDIPGAVASGTTLSSVLTPAALMITGNKSAGLPKTTTLAPGQSSMISVLSVSETPAIKTTPTITTITTTKTSETANIANIPSGAAQPIKDEVPPLQEVTGESMVPVTTTPAPTGEDSGGEDAGKRRIITYDQRQEGQYNIRADLENFIIVLIPPTPSEGINLLDVLTKSTFRHSSSLFPGKPKRLLSEKETGSGGKYHQKAHQPLQGQQSNILSRYSSSRATPSSLAQLQELFGGGSAAHAAPSSYLIDLSSTDTGHTRLHPDHQVDVLPPSYPLAYQHLIKPFHLEAEPTVIQAIPPSAVVHNSQGANDFLATYNHLLSTASASDRKDAISYADPRASRSQDSSPADSDFYRVSRDLRQLRSPRAVRSDNLLDANSIVTSTNSLLQGPEAYSLYARSSHLPIFRADLSLGSRANYPPIDVPRLRDYLNAETNSRTLALNSNEEREFEEGRHVDEIIVPAPVEDELNLDLNSTGFLDTEVKSLLSDGLERCAPGRRRDSYGVCREIEGY